MLMPVNSKSAALGNSINQTSVAEYLSPGTLTVTVRLHLWGWSRSRTAAFAYPQAQTIKSTQSPSSSIKVCFRTTPGCGSVSQCICSVCWLSSPRTGCPHGSTTWGQARSASLLPHLLPALSGNRPTVKVESGSQRRPWPVCI